MVPRSASEKPRPAPPIPDTHRPASTTFGALASTNVSSGEANPRIAGAVSGPPGPEAAPSPAVTRSAGGSRHGDDLRVLPPDVEPAVNRERLAVVLRQSGPGLNLVRAGGPGDILIVERARGAGRIVDVGQDSTVEDDRGQDVESEKIGNLQRVDHIGIFLPELGPLDSQIVLRRQRSRIEIAQHD